ncbi:hypothetical protein Pla22_07720 [Rubripirellula amarantea]|uniref:Uncharacterized protein n=1 Tax=Rubripirellula amarantea TaxID=2527999 RepID=A0A5C5WQH3_9BACT|nr:hypothetical protein Pla22_07720 [Rubripirellula amarantea]
MKRACRNPNRIFIFRFGFARLCYAQIEMNANDLVGCRCLEYGAVREPFVF